MPSSGRTRSASPIAEESRKAKRQKTISVRSRASLACETCRERKVRCDIQSLPSGSCCTRCQNSNVECVVNRFSDRRKHGSKEHLTTLQHQIRSLEALVRQSVSLGPSANGQPAHLIERQVSGHSHGANGGALNLGIGTQQPRAHAANGATNPDYAAGSLPNRSLDSFTISDHGVPNNGVSDEHVTGTTPFDTFSLTGAGLGQDGSFLQGDIAQSKRFSSPGQASRSRSVPLQSPQDARSTSTQANVFYGPTCPLHVTSPSTTTRDSPAKVPASSDIHIDMDSPRLKTVLFENYCRFQTLSVSIVHREGFLAHQAIGLRSQHYSVFLEYSLLACGARLSTSAAIRSLGLSYSGRAKSEIVSELEDPNMATLRGMLLLSDYEMSVGRDRVGWMYCGIACRLIFDLGLHNAMSSPNNDTNEAEGLSDHNVAMGCLVYETLWSLYLGRPSHIALSNFSLCAFGTKRSGHLTLKAWFDLSVLISEMTALYNWSPTMTTSIIDRLTKLDEDLRRWLADLPSEIALEDNNIASLDAVAYGLHMQFLRVQALVHTLPMSTQMREKQIGSSDIPAVLGSSTEEASRILIHDNAVQIARLASTYKEIFGVENTPSVMLDNIYMAATTLVATVMKSGAVPADENDIRWLRKLDELMKDLQVHFPITSRMRKTLARIKQGCIQLTGIFADDVDLSNTESMSIGKQSDLQHFAWGSFEAAINDFVFDPDLVNYIDFDNFNS